MTARRAAALAAVGSVLAWGLKAVAIAIAGGLDRSPFEGPLFVLGLILLLAAFGFTGLAVTAGRATALRILAAVAAVVIGVLAFLLVEGAVGALVPESAGWVNEEAGLWVVSVLTAIVLVAWWRREEQPGGPLHTV